MKILRASVVMAVATAIASFGIQQANANSIGFDIGIPNSAISSYTGPYVHVTVSTTGANTASVQFTSLSNGNNMYLMGDGGSFDVNVNAASFGISSVVLTQSAFMVGFQSPTWLGTSSGNVSTFGTFNGENDTFDGWAHAISQVNFTLTNNSGTWADAASVLTPNSSGFEAAAHIFIGTIRGDGTVNQADGAVVTGFAANGTGSHSTPDGGSTCLMLGLVVSGMGLLKRKLSCILP